MPGLHAVAQAPELSGLELMRGLMDDTKLDLGSHRGRHGLRQLIDVAGQHRRYSPNGVSRRWCRHERSVPKLEISW